MSTECLLLRALAHTDTKLCCGSPWRWKRERERERESGNASEVFFMLATSPVCRRVITNQREHHGGAYVPTHVSLGLATTQYNLSSMGRPFGKCYQTGNCCNLSLQWQVMKAVRHHVLLHWIFIIHTPFIATTTSRSQSANSLNTVDLRRMPFALVTSSFRVCANLQRKIETESRRSEMGIYRTGGRKMLTIAAP